VEPCSDDTGLGGSVVGALLLDSSCSLEEGQNLALTQDDIDEMEDSTSSILGAGGGAGGAGHDVACQDDVTGSEYGDDDEASSTSSRLMIAE
jgi:hypothetical protein